MYYIIKQKPTFVLVLLLDPERHLIASPRCSNMNLTVTTQKKLSIVQGIQPTISSRFIDFMINE